MGTVAIIGASNTPGKYGNRAVRAYLRQGWTVYPVNPNEPLVEGLPVYRRILDIPAKLDRAALYVPPAVGIKLLEEIKLKGVGELFVNPGAGSDELMAQTRRLGINAVEACAIVAIGEAP